VRRPPPFTAGQAKVLDAGIDGVIVNLPFYTPGVVAAVGDALRPLVGV
jgi:hypothetical protein